MSGSMSASTVQPGAGAARRAGSAGRRGRRLLLGRLRTARHQMGVGVSARWTSRDPTGARTRRRLDRRCGRLTGHGAAADGGNYHDEQQHPGEQQIASKTQRTIESLCALAAYAVLGLITSDSAITRIPTAMRGRNLSAAASARKR